MEKKEFPKKEFFREMPDRGAGGWGNSGGKMSHFSSRCLSILKFLLGVFLLIFVYSFTVALLKELKVISPVLQRDFWAGVISFLVFYLFIFEPVFIYRRGHKILEVLFKFFAPLVKTAPYVLPIYAIVICVIYGLLTLVIKSGELVRYFMFLFSFSLMLHIIFTAKTLRAKHGDFIKSNYLFGISFIYILNCVLAAFCLSLIFDKFSFISFFNSAYQTAGGIFQAIFRQIFIPS